MTMTNTNKARQYIQTLSKDVIFTRKTISNAIECSNKSLTTLFKELRDAGLISLLPGSKKETWRYKRISDIKLVYTHSIKLDRSQRALDMNLLDKFIYRPVMQIRTDVRYNASHAVSFGSAAHV